MSETGSPLQVWELTADSGRHRVEARGSFSRRLRWYVDEELVVEKRSMDDTVRLTSKTRPELGVVRIRFSGLGSPRRATLFEPDADGLDAEARAVAGIGGIDLAPERGSPAAKHEEQLRHHPRRYATIPVLTSIMAVLVSVLLGTLLVRFAFSLLPSLPLPRVDLPDLPIPDFPGIPLPEWSLPGWLRRVLEYAKYVTPIVIAAAVALSEIARRRKQDELRARRSAPGDVRDED
ncbi:MAG TPA: hypothetical protein VJ649_03960 [Actinomycetes bacterium]|nr:hypothetical protein [Actinomycetes bacterium]